MVRQFLYLLTGVSAWGLQASAEPLHRYECSGMIGYLFLNSTPEPLYDIGASSIRQVAGEVRTQDLQTTSSPFSTEPRVERFSTNNCRSCQFEVAQGAEGAVTLKGLTRDPFTTRDHSAGPRVTFESNTALEAVPTRELGSNASFFAQKSGAGSISIQSISADRIAVTSDFWPHSVTLSLPARIRAEFPVTHEGGGFVSCTITKAP